MATSQLPWLAAISAAGLKRLFESNREREQLATRSAERSAPNATTPRRPRANARPAGLASGQPLRRR